MDKDRLRGLTLIFKEKIADGELHKDKRGYYKTSKQFEGLTTRIDARGTTAEELAFNILKKYEDKTAVSNMKEKYGMPFDVVAENWFEQDIVGRGLAENNIKNYRGELYNHILPVFGDYGIKDIKCYHLTEFLNSKSDLSKSFVKKLSDDLKLIFKYALKNDFIDKDPSAFIKLPKCKTIIKDTDKPLTVDEFKLALRTCSKDRMMTLMLCMLYAYGLRTVELVNLKWDNINFDEDYIFIEKSKYTEAITTTDKSTKQRYLPLIDSVKKLLLDEKQSQQDKGLSNIYIFHRKNNLESQLDSKTVDKYFKTLHRNMDIENGATVENNKIVKSTNIRRFVPYAFRKTVSTNFDNVEVQESVVQSFIGHKPTTVLGKHYIKRDFDKDLRPLYCIYMQPTNKFLTEVLDEIYYNCATTCHDSQKK